MKPVVELDNVSKVYKTEATEFVALDKVSLKINKGELVSIMGPSGSGKSTLLHVIGTLDRPTIGKVYSNGRDLSKLTDSELARIRGKEIGFVFQFFNLYPTLTVLENVELPMVIMEKDKNHRLQKAKKLLGQVGLESKLDSYPTHLSGGQKQRVAIARALANDPSFILADEPTGNLDSKSGKEIMKILVELNKEGKTIIVITHDSAIASHSRRTIKIKDGRIRKED